MNKFLIYVCNYICFSMLMRSVGGFFIKRRLDCREGKRDIVYRAILHSYMTRTLTDNNDLEFFIEGGRTRTGKPCLPKGQNDISVMTLLKVIFFLFGYLTNTIDLQVDFSALSLTHLWQTRSRMC